MTDPVFGLVFTGEAEVIPGDPPEETDESVDTNDEGDTQ